MSSDPGRSAGDRAGGARADDHARPTGRPGDGPKRWRRGGGIWLLYLLSPLGGGVDRSLGLIGQHLGTSLLLAFAACYLFLVPMGW